VVCQDGVGGRIHGRRGVDPGRVHGYRCYLWRPDELELYDGRFRQHESLLFVAAVGLILAWKVSGTIGVDFFLLRWIGTPWRVWVLT